MHSQILKMSIAREIAFGWVVSANITSFAKAFLHFCNYTVTVFDTRGEEIHANQ